MFKELGISEDNIEVYQRALDRWGESSQVVMFMEEASELIKELSKVLRGKGSDTNLIEEIADVEIMLEQMKFLYVKNEDDFYTIKQNKIDRLNNIIEER